MDKPLISVILPVYNVVKYLSECMTSLFDQTYENLEFVMVDDGSTNKECSKMGDEFLKKDKRVVVFHKENGGSSSARNVGIREAKGDYLGFIDSDDYIEPDMYELLASTIVKYDAPMAQVSRDEVDEEDNRMPDGCIPPKEEWLITPQEMMNELLMHRGDASFCTRLTKRSLFDGQAFPEGKLNEDFYLLTHILHKIEKLVILPKQCYHVFYRIGSNSRKKDKNDFSRVFSDNVENADMGMELVKEHYPELVSVAFRFGCFQRLDYLLHIPIGQMTKDNVMYKNVVSVLRHNIIKMLRNPNLTGKNKIYLLLLSDAPKGVRQGHAALKNR